MLSTSILLHISSLYALISNLHSKSLTSGREWCSCKLEGTVNGNICRLGTWALCLISLNWGLRCMWSGPNTVSIWSCRGFRGCRIKSTGAGEMPGYVWGRGWLIGGGGRALVRDLIVRAPCTQQKDRHWLLCSIWGICEVAEFSATGDYWGILGICHISHLMVSEKVVLEI